MTKNQFWKGSTFFVLFSFDLTLLEFVLTVRKVSIFAKGIFSLSTYCPTYEKERNLSMFKVLSQRFGPDFKIEGWSKPWSKSLFENFKWYIVVDSVWALWQFFCRLQFSLKCLPIVKTLFAVAMNLQFTHIQANIFFCILVTIYFS